MRHRTFRIGLGHAIGTSALALSLSACGSMQMPKAQPGSFADRGSQAAGAAVGDTYNGFGEAAQAPLRDLNMVREQAPPILVRAYARPYDQTGLETCPAIADQVHQLDLALGPDVDIPRAESEDKDMFAKGASFAADAALDAVRSATTGIIPVRSWVRRFSGANRAEQEAKAVALAGSVRRGYLKALGQQKGCDWPAAPLKAGAPRPLGPDTGTPPPAALEAASHTAAAGGQLATDPPAKPRN